MKNVEWSAISMDGCNIMNVKNGIKMNLCVHLIPVARFRQQNQKQQQLMHQLALNL